MNKLTLTLFILLGLFTLTACNRTTSQLELEVAFIDLGDVVNGEIVARDILVHNTGEASLIVDAVSTSCGCTSASLDPMTISAGETGNLHIEMDTGAHGPELTGPLVRQVFIMSNDPDQPEAQVELTVNILERP